MSIFICRFHVECLMLNLEELKDDVDFYCPTCVPEQEEKFSRIKAKLKAKIDELAQRQIEFGGVTIDRDFFKDKKNANPHNYSQEFPPTLRDLGIRVNTSHKTMAHFKSDYKEMCKQLTEQLKEDFESRIQMVEWELDDIVEDVLKPDPVPDPLPDYEDLDPSDASVDSYQPSVDSSVSSVDQSELNYGGLCQNCDTRFSSPIIYKCIRGHQVCYPCRNLLSGCICPICYKTHGDRRKLTQDIASAMMYRLANASNFDPSSLVPPKRRPRRPKKLDLITHAAEDTGGSLTPRIMNVWSCAEEASSTLVMSAPVAVKTEPEDRDPSQVNLARVIPESDLSSNMLTLMNTDVLASTSTDLLTSSPLSSPDQQPVNYNDPDDGGSHSEDSRSISSQSEDRGPVKVRRISGEEWMQSLSGPSTKTSAGTNSKVWEQYQQRAKLSGGVTNLGGGVTIQVNPALRTKIVKQSTMRPSTVVSSAVHYCPDKGDQLYQPSDTDRYQTQSSSHSYSHLLPKQPAPRPQLRNFVCQQGLRQPHKTFIVRPYQPQQMTRSLRLVQPKSAVKKMIIVKNPSLQFYTDPLATSSSVASDATSHLVGTDEGQFITPDQIQEGFNEIEKYLEADDDNIFENVDSVQNDPGDGVAQSIRVPSNKVNLGI